MKTASPLYPECEKCNTLADCPHPEVEDNLLGTPMCPEGCPRPIEVMKATLKVHKRDHKFMREN